MEPLKSNHSHFSYKQIKAAVKEDESILLGKKPKGVDVGRAIYELVQSGIKGIIKKDALIAAIADLTVSNNICVRRVFAFLTFD